MASAVIVARAAEAVAVEAGADAGPAHVCAAAIEVAAEHVVRRLAVLRLHRQHAARPLLASVGLRWLRLRLRFCLRLRLWATTLSSILVAPEHTTHDSSNHLVSSRVCKAALKTDDLPATCERKGVLCVFLPRRTSNRIVRIQLVHTFEVCTTGLHVGTSSILPNSS